MEGQTTVQDDLNTIEVEDVEKKGGEEEGLPPEAGDWIATRRERRLPKKSRDKRKMVMMAPQRCGPLCECGERVKLGSLKPVLKEGLKAVGKPGWKKVRFCMDSGANETVMDDEDLEEVETTESWGSKHGQEYEVANGVKIPNLGEKEFVGWTEQGQKKAVKAQVREANKALLSVKKLTTAGNMVVFDQEGSYIMDTGTREVTWLKEDNGMYMLRMWVQRPF